MRKTKISNRIMGGIIVLTIVLTMVSSISALGAYFGQPQSWGEDTVANRGCTHPNTYTISWDTEYGPNPIWCKEIQRTTETWCDNTGFSPACGILIRRTTGVVFTQSHTFTNVGNNLWVCLKQYTINGVTKTCGWVK